MRRNQRKEQEQMDSGQHSPLPPSEAGRKGIWGHLIFSSLLFSVCCGGTDEGQRREVDSEVAK